VDSERSPRGERELGTVTFRDVLGVGEFRILWVTYLLSIIGDQIARVALSVLVYSRTGSAVLTALTYAISFLPWLIGGPLLGGLADRFPRRTVMVVSDLIRALLVAVMVIEGLPLVVLLCLLFLVELCSPPFAAARAATVPLVVSGERYVVGATITNISAETSQILGFGLAGGLVGLIGARGGLMVDAATFLISAGMLRFGLRDRPLDRSGSGEEAEGWRAELAAGARLVFGDRRLRTLAVLAFLCSIYMAPEALAVPIVHTTAGGAIGVGIMLAANPAGSVLGYVLLTRFVSPEKRLRWMVPMAVMTGLPLLPFIARPSFIVMCLLLAVSGALAAYNLPANAAFVQAVPDRRRGQAMSLVQAGMAVGQGGGFLIAGAVAEVIDARVVVALAGGLTVIVMGVLVAAGQTHTRLVGEN
jgi:MFS family permease